MPTAPHQLREEVRRMILSSARDLADDSVGIGEMFTGDLPADPDEYDRAIDEIGEMIRTATVTIAWPEEEAPEPLGWMVVMRDIDGDLVTWGQRIRTEDDALDVRGMAPSDAFLAVLYRAGQPTPAAVDPWPEAPLTPAARPAFMIAVRGCDDCSSEPGEPHHPTCPRPAQVVAERAAERAQATTQEPTP
jgi:hypothetical protein